MSAQLAILGLLVEQPLHGYGVEQLIEQRGMRNWTPIGFSSIYQLLDQLVTAGLAEVRVEPAPGRGKRRRVHHVTAAGRQRWTGETLGALADAGGSVGDFLLALSGLPLLDPDDAATALRRRVEYLESRVDGLERDLAVVRPVPAHVEAMFDFTRTRLIAERDWVRAFLTDLPANPRMEVPS
jgi:DNA-binding PadR family transcriptional regulator